MLKFVLVSKHWFSSLVLSHPVHHSCMCSVLCIVCSHTLVDNSPKGILKTWQSTGDQIGRYSVMELKTQANVIFSIYMCIKLQLWKLPWQFSKVPHAIQPDRLYCCLIRLLWQVLQLNFHGQNLKYIKDQDVLVGASCNGLRTIFSDRSGEMGCSLCNN